MWSPMELGIVAVLVVLLFGTRKLPELGSGLGKAISNFKRSYREASEIDVTPTEKVEEQSSGSMSKDSSSEPSH